LSYTNLIWFGQTAARTETKANKKKNVVTMIATLQKSVVTYSQQQLMEEVRQREAQIAKIKKEVEADNGDNILNPVPVFQQIG
jgi:hypothetical protein